MTCRRVTELITDYLEGTLPEGDRRRFETHLAGCDGCEAYVEQMRATIETLGEIDLDGAPDDVVDELIQLYRQYRAT